MTDNVIDFGKANGGGRGGGRDARNGRTAKCDVQAISPGCSSWVGH